MNTAVSVQKASDIMEALIARGDLSQLSSEEKAKYYVKVCESLGLNPMTQPFDYITLSGRLTLYVNKDGTAQLRSIHNVSVIELTERERDGVFTVIAKVSDKEGRTDMATGAVYIAGLRGENLANAIMKAETKAKRRATLSICGLGFLDESELPASAAQVSHTPPQNRPRLADQLDALAPSNSGNAPAEKPKRGRPLKKPDDFDDAEIEPCDHTWGGTSKNGEPTCIKCGELRPGDEPVLTDDDWPGPEISDYARGKADATAGHVSCLNRDIRDDAARLAEWQRGYDSVKRKRP